MWLHHEITFERLTAPWQERFDYIATKKPEEERAWRFRLLRPTSPEAMKQFGITTTAAPASAPPTGRNLP